jgi:hypothetical protein
MDYPKYLVITNSIYASDPIDVTTDQIKKLCRSHKLINILVEDCTKDNKTNTLIIKIPKEIYIDKDTAKYIFQLEPLKETIYKTSQNFKSMYKSFILMDYMMSNKNVKNNLKDCFLNPHMYELFKLASNTNIPNMIYSIATLYKLLEYDALNHINYIIFDIFKQSVFDDMMQEIFHNELNYSDIDIHLIVYLYNILNDKFVIYDNIETSENDLAKERFKLLFGDLLDGFEIKNDFVIAGGSINICLDNSIDIDQNRNTDLDIFLMGTEAEQKNSLNYILKYFIDKFGISRIYMNEMSAIKYLWISDTCYHIQIIGTTYKSADEIISYFDMSHVKCWYNGNKFYKSIDCNLSIKSKITFASIIPISDVRAYKTIKRGYKIKPLTYKFPNDTKHNYVYNLLSSYDVNKYNSLDVDKYIYVQNNYCNLMPKTTNSIILNKLNLSVISGINYSKIFTFEELYYERSKNNYYNNMLSSKYKELYTKKYEKKRNELKSSNKIISDTVCNEYESIDDDYEDNDFEDNNNKNKNKNDNENNYIITFNDESIFEQLISDILSRHKSSFSVTRAYCDINFNKFDSTYTNAIYKDLIKNINTYKINLEQISHKYNNNKIIAFELDFIKISHYSITEELQLKLDRSFISNLIIYEYNDIIYTRYIMMLQQDKNDLYLIMNALLDKLKPNFDSCTVNINEMFTHTPDIIFNKSENYIGNYLICKGPSDGQIYSKLRENKSTYHDIIMKFTAVVSISDNKKNLIRIYPTIVNQTVKKYYGHA